MKASKPYSITGDLKAFDQDYIERCYFDNSRKHLARIIEQQKFVIEELKQQLEFWKNFGLGYETRPTRDGKVIKIR